MSFSAFIKAATEAVAWIVNPMSLPWRQSQNRAGRLAAEVVGVAALPLVYNWLSENALNVRVAQPNLLVFLGEVGLPLMAAVFIGFLPAFRQLDFYQASLVGLWVQRALTVQLILLGLWATILAFRNQPVPEAGEMPLWLSFEFAFWISGGVVGALAIRAMRSGPGQALWRELVLAVALYFVVLAVLRFANIPEVFHPWFPVEP